MTFYKYKLIKLIRYLPLVFLLFLGGAFQFVGLFSQTFSNYILMTLMCLVVTMFPRFFKDNVKILSSIIIFLCLTLLYIVIFVPNNITSLLVYFYYIIFFTVSVIYSKFIYDSGIIEVVIKYSTIFILLQVFVCTFQTIFAEILSSKSAVSLIPLDMVSGTLYLGSDAILCVLIVSINIFMKLNGKFSNKRIILTYLLGLVVVFLTNSKAMQAVYLLYPIFLIFENFRLNQNRVRFNGFVIYMFILIVFLVSAYSNFLIEPLNYLMDLIYDGYFRIKYGAEGSRLSGLGFIFTGNFEYTGFGLLTYYNPISKEWLFNAGFSSFYLMLLDLGVIYLVLFYILSAFVIIAADCKSFISYYLYIVFFVFSLFGLVFTTGVVIMSILLCVYSLRQNRLVGRMYAKKV
jgi:hypothetical protein